MKMFGLKRVYLFFTSFFVFILHLPFVFAKSKPADKLFADDAPLKPVTATAPMIVDPVVENEVIPSKFSMYDSLKLGTLGLCQEAYEHAVKGFTSLVNAGKIVNRNIISIIDFSKPSSSKRLFVIDIRSMKVLYHTYVAHGVNSGKDMASRFSNIPESNMSSPGFYQTLSTYEGKNGYSLHLNGLERGINDQAYNRDIVMHGAEYVSEDFIRNQGYLGRSWGCPAVSQKLSKPIIDRIKNGTCLYIYSPDRTYAKSTRLG